MAFGRYTEQWLSSAQRTVIQVVSGRWQTEAQASEIELLALRESVKIDMGESSVFVARLYSVSVTAPRRQAPRYIEGTSL